MYYFPFRLQHLSVLHFIKFHDSKYHNNFSSNSEEQSLELYGCHKYILDIASERRADDFSVSPLMTLWIQGKYEEIFI